MNMNYYSGLYVEEQAEAEAQAAMEQDGGSRYPIGTRAYDIQGGHWKRVSNGWNWCAGLTFPTPGGNAIYVAVAVIR